MGKYTVREPRADLEDLRDDTIAVVLNSGLTFQQIEDQGGPTRNTISKWLYKETKFPRLDTARSILQICGFDFAVAKIDVAVGDHVISRTGIARPQTTLKLPIRKRVRKGGRVR